MFFSCFFLKLYSAVQVGKSVLFFAGGAQNSSRITITEIPPVKNNPTRKDSLRLRAANLGRYSIRPIPRMSAVMVSLGRYLVVFGGFNNRRQQLDDFLVTKVLALFTY